MIDIEKKFIIEEKSSIETLWLHHNDWREAQEYAQMNSNIFHIEKNRIFVSELIKAIANAKKIVCVCTFLLNDTELVDALLKAAQRGVRVYMFVASEAKLLREIKQDQDFDKKTLAEHKDLLQKIAGKLWVGTSDSFHAKFILVDPNLEDAKGFLSTANFTKEALTDRIEIGVKLKKMKWRNYSIYFVMLLLKYVKEN